MSYVVDSSDPRNQGLRLLPEEPETQCFADDIPGTAPFRQVEKGLLYRPIVWESSGDACAESLKVDKVAIMLMTKGSIHHHAVWRQWFASAAGKIPIDKQASCSMVDIDTVPEACGFLTDIANGDVSTLDILDDPLKFQTIFNVYVHVPPGNENELEPLFRPHVIPRRVNVEWGEPSMIYAMRELIWFAFQDPLNQRFVLLSESDIPIYGPLPFYHEMMSETKSRVDTSLKLPSDKYRWHFRFMCGTPPILERDWRKSSQWFTLIRDHAELVLQDTGIYRSFERFCTSFWDDAHDWYRVCYSDEHYIPTLLQVMNESHRTYRTRGPSHVDWSRGGAHPAEYSPENITSNLVSGKLRVNIDCIRGQVFQTSWIREVEQEHFIDVVHEGSIQKLLDICLSLENEEKGEKDRMLAMGELYQPKLGQLDPEFIRSGCPLSARKFKVNSVDAVLGLWRDDCKEKAGTRLGLVDDRVCASFDEWKSKNDRTDFEQKFYAPRE
jgi:hypothetical protein